MQAQQENTAALEQRAQHVDSAQTEEQVLFVFDDEQRPPTAFVRAVHQPQRH
jgi:hypothetical protein